MLLCLAAPLAVALSCFIGFLFVALLYVGVQGIPDRDDPRVIKDRFVRISAASLLAALIVACATSPRLQQVDHCRPSAPALQWFGIWSSTNDLIGVATASLAPLALTTMLFFGPLVQGWFDRSSNLSAPLLPQTQEEPGVVRLMQARNLIIGPVAEEWTFRMCMCPLLVSCGYSKGQVVLLASLIFGAAHVHHRLDARASWIAVVVQFTYTSLFGAYSSYLFLRTGLIYGPVLAHSFCNFMGLPNFAGVPGHRQSRTLAGAYVVGLLGFTITVVVDAVFRPRLFNSMYWDEQQ
mmetsp:Transcript_27141/g.82286  ORF Transcript_27141/g.82286 Transcript_27141/m.82286 type:complete len:293 (+) Transcript_27141:173-1051(+)|eukprot:scaffold20206_cov34-Tisochrysis_lutea.AAC.3